MTEREMEYFPDGTPIDDWFYETRIKKEEPSVPYGR